MEREFLLGVSFQLFVDAQTYDSWLNLLKGLVLTKERELNRWRERRRTRVIIPRIRIPNSSDYTRQAGPQQRARSTSPHHPRNYSYAPAYPFTFSVPSSSAAQLQASSQSHAQSQSAHCSPNRPMSSKRTAADAFSPTSSTFAGSARGGKRPTGLALDIPAALASASSTNRYSERAGSVSAYPAYTYTDSLCKLERMSLATPTEPQSGSDAGEVSIAEGPCQESREQTLAAPYRGLDAARRPPPPHLYFYSLASSPLASSYAAVAAAPETDQPSGLYASPVDANPSAIEEPHVATKTVDVFPAGADRKARLRYVDSRPNGGYSNDYSYGYGSTQTQNDPVAHQSVYPARVPNTAHRYSAAFHHAQAPAIPHHRPQPVQQTHQLPPLTLALSMHRAPSQSLVTQTQSDRASPLPKFASLNAYISPQAEGQPRSQDHAYTSYNAQVYPINDHSTNSCGYPARPNPAPVVESAWSAPASETVDGVYAPVARHVQPNGPVVPQTYSHPQTSAPTTYGSYASPMYAYSSEHYTRQSTTTEPVPQAAPCPCHESSLPERAAFANAGPPGVAHFYPYTRSGPLQGTEGYKDAYGVYQNAGKVAHQSYSTSASPEGSYMFGYGYSRGRR